MGRYLTEKDVEPAILGGSVFACGGGGWADHGRMLGQAATAAGRPELVSIEEAAPDAWIATAAAIGAPAGTTDWEMRPEDYVKAVELLQQALGAPLYGLIVGQNGKSSTLNAWLPGAVLGTKVIDAVGDIRAHPTGDMGALGLGSSLKPMIQTAVGGNRAQGRYIELVVRGANSRVSPVLRKASDESGGFIASCRNPITAAFVKQRAALGGVSLALALGEAIQAAETGGRVAAILDFLGGEILGEGEVTRFDVAYTNEAFDIGTITVKCPGKILILHVMNEYMAVDGADGERLATYPDVITTLDPEGRPLSVGELRVGTRLAVLRVAKDRIPLSASVFDPTVYPPVEKALGINLSDYALEGAPQEAEGQ